MAKLGNAPLSTANIKNEYSYASSPTINSDDTNKDNFNQPSRLI